MATPAHCIYCFESLAAALGNGQVPSLQQVQKLWDQYDGAKSDHPDYQEDDDENDDNDDDEEDVDDDDDEEQSQEQEEEEDDDKADTDIDGDLDLPDEAPPTSLRVPVINRLIAPSPSSVSSSSTPSLVSTSSSSRDLASASSKSSSSSSFFSFGRSSARSQKPAARSTDDDRPLFVTWSTVSRSGNKNLRGCIGTFEPQELSEGLRSYALTSAFDDSRFAPISKKELPSLEVGVTLLTDFEPAPTPLSWDMGVHGLRISFTYHSRRYGATYLPFVAIDQGWTREETVISLMRKAGWIGRKEDWRKVSDLKVVRYQGKKVTIGYREWKEWRDWADEAE